MAFVVYEAVYFFYPKARWWGYSVPSVSYSFYVVALMGLVFLLKKDKGKNHRIMEIPQTKWIWILFLNWFLIGFIAIYPERHSLATDNYFKMLVTISFAFYLVDDEKDFDLVIWGYLFGAWYLGFVAFQTGRNSGDRVEGIGTVDTGGDANMTAATLVPALVLFLYYFWFSKKVWHKGIFALGGAFVANAIVLINSRGAFLGVIASSLFFMKEIYFSRTRAKHQTKKAIFFTVCGLACLGSVIDQSTIDRFNSIKEATNVSDEGGSDGGTRTLFWKATFDLVKDHPFGAGEGTFEYYGGYYVPEYVNMGSNRNRAVHSTWFEALSELGYPGLTFFVILLFSCMRAMRKAKTELKRKNKLEKYYQVVAIQSAFIGFMVTMTFINRLRAEVLYWLILYTMIAYNTYVLKPRNAPGVYRR